MGVNHTYHWRESYVSWREIIRMNDNGHHIFDNIEFPRKRQKVTLSREVPQGEYHYWEYPFLVMIRNYYLRWISLAQILCFFSLLP